LRGAEIAQQASRIVHLVFGYGKKARGQRQEDMEELANPGLKVSNLHTKPLVLVRAESRIANILQH